MTLGNAPVEQVPRRSDMTMPDERTRALLW